MTEWEKYYTFLIYKSTSLKVEHLQEPEYIRRVKHMEKLVKYHDQDSSKNTA